MRLIERFLELFLEKFFGVVLKTMTRGLCVRLDVLFLVIMMTVT